MIKKLNTNFANLLLTNNTLFRFVFFQFLTQQIHQIRLISKKWNQKVKQILSHDLNTIKSKLQSKYSSMFMIQQNPHFNIKEQLVMYRTPDNTKVNIDYLIKLHLKQKYQFKTNTNYTISYSYQLNSYPKKKLLKSRKKCKKYFWKLEFQYIGDQNTSKTVWMYKDYRVSKCYQSDNQAIDQKQIDQDYVPYIMDCQPVRKNQILQIRLPYCVRNGLIDLNKLQFYPIEQDSLSPLSTIQRFFNKSMNNNKVSTKNECHIQKEFQWKKYDYYKNPISFQLDDAINMYKEELTMQDIRINNLQDHFRIQFMCKKPLKQNLFMGHIIEILSIQNKYLSLENCPVIQLKRKGTYEQKKKKLTFRVGDKLLLYLCDLKDL